MKRLFLLRHAKAEVAGEAQDDRARNLAPRGRDDAAAMGTYLREIGARPQRMLVSPAARTLQTAALVQQALGLPGQPESPEQLYLASPGQILRLVHETPVEVGQLLVIGHNPGLEQAATLLAREKLKPGGKMDALAEKFPTCALAVLDFAIADWRDCRPGEGHLADFVRPKDL